MNLLAELPLFADADEVNNFEVLQEVLIDTVFRFNYVMVGNIINSNQYIESNSKEKDYFSDGIYANMIFKDTVFDEFLEIIRSEKRVDEILNYNCSKRCLIDDEKLIINMEGRGGSIDIKDIIIDNVDIGQDKIIIYYQYYSESVNGEMQEDRIATINCEETKETFWIESNITKFTEMDNILGIWYSEG